MLGTFPRETISPEQESALREAISAAARPQPYGEALDWQSSEFPEHWKLDQKQIIFKW